MAEVTRSCCASLTPGTLPAGPVGGRAGVGAAHRPSLRRAAVLGNRPRRSFLDILADARGRRSGGLGWSARRIPLRRVAAALLVLLLPDQSHAQEGKGSISGTMSAPVEASNGRVNVQVRGMGFEGMVMADSKGRYKIGNVPAGMRELCVQGHPYRTVFDTVKVVEAQAFRRDYVLQPLSSRHQSVPHLRSLPADTVRRTRGFRDHSRDG